MNRKPHIEELLMRFRSEPGARVKRAVLARYAERYGHRRWRGAGTVGLWRRPVPLYVATALVLVATGLSFMGGQKLSRPERIAPRASNATQDSLAGTVLEQSWHYAPRDVF